MEDHFALSESFQEEPEKSIIVNISNFVKKKDYDGIERYFSELIKDGLFDRCLTNVFQTEWAQLEPSALLPESPILRASFASCIDIETQTIYMHGGYNYDWLNDFWAYDINSSEYTRLSANTELEGGPSPRAFHTMCLNKNTKDIYFLGRSTTDTMVRENNYKSDFYVYNIINKRWRLLSRDTSIDGGPKLLVAHQIAFDDIKNDIYVYGGKILTEFMDKVTVSQLVKQSVMFGGLYAYNTVSQTWRIMCDEGTTLKPVLLGRMNHSMVFHPTSRNLFIFGGKRNRCHFLDLFTYNVDTGEVAICDSCSLATTSFPTRGLHQATIDINRDEIYVFTGAFREGIYAPHQFWVYFIKNDKWLNIPIRQPPTMRSRDAQIMLYNHADQKHYIFGGFVHSEKIFLNDFWTCQFKRMGREEYALTIKKQIRKQKLEEMLFEDDLAGALTYLRDEITPLIMQGEDPHEVEIFTSRFLDLHPDIEGSRVKLFSLLAAQIIRACRHWKGSEKIINDILCVQDI